MVQGQYPIINQGLGKLTVDVWKRLMDMLRTYEQKSTDERARAEGGGGSGGIKPFLAKIREAKCIDPNRYKYSWIQVALQDDNTVAEVDGGKSSTGDGDDYDYAAINLLEIANTNVFTSVGVSMSGTYPSGWAMQAVGGGSCSGTDCVVTLTVNPIVLMHTVTGTSVEKTGGTTSRYIFSVGNEHDGVCTGDAVSLTDGIATPTIPVDATFGYLYIGTDGELHFVDKDEDDHELLWETP